MHVYVLLGQYNNSRDVLLLKCGGNDILTLLLVYTHTCIWASVCYLEQAVYIHACSIYNPFIAMVLNRGMCAHTHTD